LIRKIELLAPGGEVDAIKAAILAGADAVYCGLDKFNARNRATNISFQQLQGILRLAHQHNCAIYITLNILIIDSEIPALFKLLNKLVNTSIDGIIIQDLGLFYLLHKYFPSLEIHASTQLTTHNEGQIPFLGQLHAERVNLSREMNLKEIKSLSRLAHKNNISTEVFVHGSNCLSFSGACYMSSVINGNSGNRGRCSQPCRDQYITTAAGKNYPLNLKDLSAFYELQELAEAGVDSLKIEGRIKKYDYVFTIVKTWREQLDAYQNNSALSADNSALFKVFNRDFSNGLLKGELHKELFIDNPRDHSIQHLSEIQDFSNAEDQENAALAFYKEKEALKKAVLTKINNCSIEKGALSIKVSGKKGFPLKIQVKSPEESFEMYSSLPLKETQKNQLDKHQILKRLKSINDTAFEINHLDLKGLDPNVFIPFNELTALKKRILYVLMNNRDFIEPIPHPVLTKPIPCPTKPRLSVLCSSANELRLFQQTKASLYYQLPNSLGAESAHLLLLFKENPRLIPWFPSIIIGDDYENAVTFLREANPRQIVTNNTGIAFEAYKMGIPWIAGPYLNIVNSFSLISLKENFHCKGAFISNELNQEQIKRIKRPENFELYFSIFHPMVLMTCRQCLFHQVSGCEKNLHNNSCQNNCEKSKSITNLRGESFFIEKSKGNLHTIYAEKHYLNTGIIKDIPDHFSNFMIDLRKIKTNTQIKKDPLELIALFENCLHDAPRAIEQLHKYIYPSSFLPYRNGI